MSTATSCFALTNSKVVPDLNGVLLSVGSQYFDTPSFDAYIASSYYNSTTTASGFSRNNGCPSFTGARIRYMALLKASFVAASSNADCAGSPNFANSVPLTPLCQDICGITVSSIRDTFGDQNVCTQNPPADIAATRSKLLTSYSSFCASQPPPSAGKCLSGPSDATAAHTCGFVNLNLAQAYCSSMPTDPCCSMLADPPKTTTDTTTSTTSSSNSTLNSSGQTANIDPNGTAFNAGAAQQDPVMSLSTGIIVSIVVAVVASIGAIIAVVFVMRRRSREKEIDHEREQVMIRATNAAAAAAAAFSASKTTPKNNPPSPDIFSEFKRPQSGVSATSASMNPAQTPRSDRALLTPTSPRVLSPPVLSMPPQSYRKSYSSKRSASDASGTPRSATHSIVSMQSPNRNSSMNVASGITNTRTSYASSSGTSSRASQQLLQKLQNLPPSALVEAGDGVIVRPGDILSVRTSYQPENDDEIYLKVGQTIVLKHAFEDGWAVGRCTVTNKVGVFPLDFTISTINTESG